jgi:hypothetical protein
MMHAYKKIHKFVCMHTKRKSTCVEMWYKRLLLKMFAPEAFQVLLANSIT